LQAGRGPFGTITNNSDWKSGWWDGEPRIDGASRRPGMNSAAAVNLSTASPLGDPGCGWPGAEARSRAHARWMSFPGSPLRRFGLLRSALQSSSTSSDAAEHRRRSGVAAGPGFEPSIHAQAVPPIRSIRVELIRSTRPRTPAPRTRKDALGNQRLGGPRMAMVPIARGGRVGLVDEQQGCRGATEVLVRNAVVGAAPVGRPGSSRRAERHEAGQPPSNWMRSRCARRRAGGFCPGAVR